MFVYGKSLPEIQERDINCCRIYALELVILKSFSLNAGKVKFKITFKSPMLQNHVSLMEGMFSFMPLYIIVGVKLEIQYLAGGKIDFNSRN